MFFAGSVISLLTANGAGTQMEIHMTNLINTAQTDAVATAVFTFAQQALNAPNVVTLIAPSVESEEAPEAYRPRTLENRRRRAQRLAGRR
jgi:hypothetical protein